MSIPVHIIKSLNGQYCLMGINQKQGKPLTSIGWRWEEGHHQQPGYWYTDEQQLAEEGARRLRQTIEEQAE